MPLHALSDDERRSHCRREIEALELWLRRLVHETFSAAYGAKYLDAKGEDGNKLFNAEMSRHIADRQTKEPSRYSRPIDATTLEDVVKVVCKTQTYNQHFREALRVAYPVGNQEARTFLGRVVEIRNNLSHANPITVHDAARAICYTQDVILSLKEYYAVMNAQNEYNVPSIIRIIDTLGNNHLRTSGESELDCRKSGRLYPGSRLTIEVEVDPTFDRSSYRLEWSCFSIGYRDVSDTNRFTINIDNSHVQENFRLTCMVISKQDWHRYGYCDDSFTIVYKVLPPLS
jgi:Swt1-like HEPN